MAIGFSGIDGQSTTITVAGTAIVFADYGTGITANITPTMSALYDGDDLTDVDFWLDYMDPGTYVPPTGHQIASVTPIFVGVEGENEAVLEDREVGVSFLVETDLGLRKTFDAGTVIVGPPRLSVVEESVITGDPVIGENLQGTPTLFTGITPLPVSSLEWEVSDDGATGWTGTADTDATGPAMVSGKYYRLSNTVIDVDDEELVAYSNVIGPARAPVITIVGASGGQAQAGDHASLSLSADIGTITATKWGSTSGGSQYGAGASPTDYSAGSVLYATATVGGVEYTVSANIIGAPAGDITIFSVTPGTYADGAIPLLIDQFGAADLDDLYIVAVPEDEQAPSTTQIAAGQNAASGSPPAAFADVVDETNGVSLTFPTGIVRGMHKAYAIIDNGTPSNVGASASFLVDTVLPVLGTPVATVTGTDIAVSVTTSKTGGTIYFARRDSANGQLLAENIIGVTGNAVEGWSAAATSGDVTFPSVPAGTWQIDVVHVDDFNNPAAVVSLSSAVTVSAGDPLSVSVPSFTGSNTYTGTQTITHTFTGVLTGQEMVVEIIYGTPNGVSAKAGVAIGALTVIEDGYQYDNGNCHCGIYRAVATADTDYTVTITAPAGSTWRGISRQGRIMANRSSAPVVVQDFENYNNTIGTPAVLTLDADVRNGDVVLAVSNMGAMGSTGDLTPTGLTEINDYTGVQGRRMQFWRADPSGTETPRTMRLTTATMENNSNVIGLAVRYR